MSKLVNVTGVNPGTANIIGTLGGLSGQKSVGVAQPSPDWPNEPAGFVTVDTREYHALNEHGWGDGGGIFSIVNDASGRTGNGKMGQRTYARHSISGDGTSGWRQMNTIANHTQYRDMYTAAFMKISSNFRQDSSGITKIWYNYGQSTNYPGANDSSQAQTRIMQPVAPVGDLTQVLLLRYFNDAGWVNVEGAPHNFAVPRNTLFLVEMLIRASSGSESGNTTNANGRVWLFINGALALDWQNVRTHRGGAAQWWRQCELNTILGGGSNRVDSWEVTGAVSGGPFQGGPVLGFVGEFQGEIIQFSNGRHGLYNPALSRHNAAVPGPNLYFMPATRVTLNGSADGFTPRSFAVTQAEGGLEGLVVSSSGNQAEIVFFMNNPAAYIGQTLMVATRNNLTHTPTGPQGVIQSIEHFTPTVGMTFNGLTSGASATISEIIHPGSMWWRFDHHRISLGNL